LDKEELGPVSLRVLCSSNATHHSTFFFFPMARQPLGGLGRLSFRGFMVTLYRHTTFGRTPLDEGPARPRDLYLTTHNTHKRQTSMPPVGIRNHNPGKPAAADPRLRPRGHWDRPSFHYFSIFISNPLRNSNTITSFLIWGFTSDPALR
jgi:hypothetical protein